MVYRFGETKASAIKTVGALSAVGLMFVVAVMIGGGIGYGLDTLLGTQPWLSLLFFFFVLAAGILNVFRMSSKFLK